MDVTKKLGFKLMLAFEGTKPSSQILNWLAAQPVAGITLFRKLNVTSPAQVRVLTNTLQYAAAQAGQPPLLIAADQEGGQLVALGDQSTQFPGNMALGAARDPELSYQVGLALGRELNAMGVNVNYSPDCDVNSNPENPNVGVRSFGDDPDLVSGMGTAMIKGLQESGVAATAKHFPGNGESAVDPHFGIPVLPHNLERLQSVEFVPFQGAIDAGVKLIMSAHVSLPEITGESDLPATLSPKIMGSLLRDDMGFKGLLISDALDMKAINQGEGKVIDVIAAVRAGIDLLLMAADGEIQRRLYAGLVQALKRGLLDQQSVDQSIDRILTLKQWVSAQSQLGLDVVGCADHHQLNSAVAARSITLVKNDTDLLPLSLDPDASVVVVMPQPTDLTPADTSSYVAPKLAESIRKYHHQVDEILIEQRPAPQSIADLCSKASNYDLIIMGTISAHLQHEQANLVKNLLSADVPIMTIALRTPYDLTAYPQAQTHICTYSIQPSSMAALADALFGQAQFHGKLPVTISGEADFGHGLSV